MSCSRFREYGLPERNESHLGRLCQRRLHCGVDVGGGRVNASQVMVSHDLNVSTELVFGFVSAREKAKRKVPGALSSCCPAPGVSRTFELRDDAVRSFVFFSRTGGQVCHGTASTQGGKLALDRDSL